MLSLLTMTILIGFVVGQLLHRSNDERRRLVYLLTSVAVNLGVLAAFKYAGFGTALETRSASKWDENGLTPKESGFLGVTDTHIQLYAEDVACKGVFDAIFNSIADLEQNGIEVIVALIPNHDAIRELNPNLVADLEKRLRNRATQVGVNLVELSGPLLDSETYDGVHPNRAGRDRLTAELAEVLAG